MAWTVIPRSVAGTAFGWTPTKVQQESDQMLIYLFNRLEGMPRHPATAQASAAIPRVLVDGKAVDDENAQRAAARALMERFSHTPAGLPSPPAQDQQDQQDQNDR
jgi:hypothetical protein